MSARKKLPVWNKIVREVVWAVEAGVMREITIAVEDAVRDLGSGVGAVAEAVEDAIADAVAR